MPCDSAWASMQLKVLPGAFTSRSSKAQLQPAAASAHAVAKRPCTAPTSSSRCGVCSCAPTLPPCNQLHAFQSPCGLKRAMHSAHLQQPLQRVLLCPKEVCLARAVVGAHAQRVDVGACGV